MWYRLCIFAQFYIIKLITNIFYMLKKILSISGKPGLYKLVSTSKAMTLVESLTDNKRFPIYAHEKIVSLGEIAIYTLTDEMPLKEVFIKIKKVEEGKKITDEHKSSNKKLFNYFETVLPEYDKDRVYASDIKKIVNWYNLLIDNELDFEVEEPLEGLVDEPDADSTGNTDNENDPDKEAKE